MAGTSGEFPFIDHAMNGGWGETTSSSWPGTPWHQCIDATGHVNNATGRNKPWAKLFYIPSYAKYSGQWNISWQGNLDWEFLLSDGSLNVVSHTGSDWTQVSATHFSGTDCTMVVSFPGNSDGRMYVRALNTDANAVGAWGKNFKMIRADQQADYNAGKIWNPVFKKKQIALNPAVFRLMDYQSTNGSQACRWEYRGAANYNGWSPGGGIGQSFYLDGAYPDAAGTNIYTVAAIGATPAALKHGEIAHVRFPNAIVRGGSLTVTGVTQANPAVVTSTAHGLQNGDLVQFYDVFGMTQLLDNEYTVAGVTANTFQLSGIDSSGYTAFTSGTCAIVCKMDVGARGSKQIKMRDGYTNVGVYPYLIGANAIQSFVYDAPTGSWLLAETGGGFNNGIPIEISTQLFVELASEGSAGPISPWFNIPHMALRSSDSDYSAASDYTKKMIAFLRDGDGTYGPLPSSCDIWLEDSNETWNPSGGFSQTSYYARQGFLRWGNSRTDFQDFSTLRAVLRLNDARTAYGVGSTRIKRVMGAQAGFPAGMVIRWDGSATLTGDVLWPGGAPGGYYDYLAVAPYLEPSDNTALLAAAAAWNGGADPSQIAVANAIFSSDVALGTGWYLKTMLPAYKTPATTYNLGIVMYEGGWGPNYQPRTANEKAFFDAIKADTRWANTVLKPFWDSWVADSQCSLPSWFDFSGSQTWSLFYPDIYTTQQPAYDMIVAFDSSSGLVQPSYGSKGKKKRIRGPYSDPLVYEAYIQRSINELRQPQKNPVLAKAIEELAVIVSLDDEDEERLAELASLSKERDALQKLISLEKAKVSAAILRARQASIERRLEDLELEEEEFRDVAMLMVACQ